MRKKFKNEADKTDGTHTGEKTLKFDYLSDDSYSTIFVSHSTEINVYQRLLYSHNGE